MNFHIITIFPEIFESYFKESIIKRAQNDNLININIYNLRDWTNDKHKKVDDTPYGGGAGMLMKVEPLYKVLEDLQSRIIKGDTSGCQSSKPKLLKILLSAQGKKWTQQKAQKYSKNYTDIILVCGRYEGVDERVLEFIDEEISIGDYVLTGGELSSMILVDSLTRLLPGVLGNDESSVDESHSVEGELEYPQYTRPEIFEVNEKKLKVPNVLLSGNHAEIKKWREGNKKKIK